MILTTDHDSLFDEHRLKIIKILMITPWYHFIRKDSYIGPS